MMERAVTVLALAFFLTSAFQTFELVREANLSALYASLEIPVQQANEVREQTVALGMETAELADKGNADAQQAVNEMRNQGMKPGIRRAGAQSGTLTGVTPQLSARPA